MKADKPSNIAVRQLLMIWSKAGFVSITCVILDFYLE
jgi:hypothetical protein